MKLPYVYNYQYLPLFDTDITFNKTDSGYYEKIIIGYVPKDNFIIPIIQSCGNGCGDNRCILEDDNTIANYVYEELTDWLQIKIYDLKDNYNMFRPLIEGLNNLNDWLKCELEKKYVNKQNE